MPGNLTPKMRTTLTTIAILLIGCLQEGQAHLGANPERCGELYGEALATETLGGKLVVLFTKGDSFVIVTFQKDEAKRLVFINPILGVEAKRPGPIPALLQLASPNEKAWKQVSKYNWEGQNSKAHQMRYMNTDLNIPEESWIVIEKGSEESAVSGIVGMDEHVVDPNTPWMDAYEKASPWNNYPLHPKTP